VRGGQLSYRRRRLLLSLFALSAAAGAVAAAIVLLPTGEKLDRGSTAPTAAPTGQSTPRTRRPTTHLSAAERHRLFSSITLFVATSVERHAPERSWPIIHPLLREGLTKRQWSTGNIPVVPYPAVGVDLIRLTSVVGGTALVEVVLEPAPRAHLMRKTFLIELRRLPRQPHRWAVSSWIPEGISESQMAVNADSRPSVVAAAYHARHLSLIWIFLPVGLLFGGLILLPTGVFVREAYRSRRAEAEFRASRDNPGEPSRSH
jgi:hypothetical protein